MKNFCPKKKIATALWWHVWMRERKRNVRQKRTFFGHTQYCPKYCWFFVRFLFLCLLFLLPLCRNQIVVFDAVLFRKCFRTTSVSLFRFRFCYCSRIGNKQYKWLVMTDGGTNGGDGAVGKCFTTSSLDPPSILHSHGIFDGTSFLHINYIMW